MVDFPKLELLGAVKKSTCEEIDCYTAESVRAWAKILAGQIDNLVGTYFEGKRRSQLDQEAWNTFNEIRKELLRVAGEKNV